MLSLSIDSATVISDFYLKPTQSTKKKVTQRQKKQQKTSLFQDSSKQDVKCYIRMIDKSKDGCPLPLSTTIPCWWHRKRFDSVPIGVPVVYHPVSIDNSELENVCSKLENMNIRIAEPSLKESGRSKNTRRHDSHDSSNGKMLTDYFEVEGIFCSFACMKAYVEDELRKGKDTYNNTLSLLTLMYMKMFDCKKIPSIKSAPSWKLLEEWGGHLSLQQFLDPDPHFGFIESVNMRRPMMYMTSAYIRERANALV